jgi:amino acid transporter
MGIKLSERIAPTTAASTAGLDATTADDVTYLGQLGYRPELRRALGLFSSFAVAFSAIAVSAGIFLTFGYGLTTFGPAFYIAWLIAGILQMMVGLSVAELVSAFPLAGGAYQIVGKIVRWPILGWQTGWMLLVAHIVAVSANSVGMAPYVAGWFGQSSLTPFQTTLWAAGILILSVAVNFLGVRVASIVNNVGVIAELVAITIVVVVILGLHRHFNGISFLTNTAGTTPNGNWYLPFLFTLLIPAFVISSFDSSGNAGEETHKAAWTAPKGLVIANFGAFAAGSVSILLLLLSITNLKAVIASSTPVATILDSAVGHFLSTIFVIVVISSLFVCNEMLLLTASRTVWSQARDGKFPFARVFYRLNRERIPWVATTFCLVVGVAILFWTSALNILIAMTALAWALGYFVAVVAGVYAKSKNALPKHPWNYGRFWLVIDGLAIFWSVVLCGAILYQNPHDVGLGILGVIALGLILYGLALLGRGSTPQESAASVESPVSTTA